MIAYTKETLQTKSHCTTVCCGIQNLTVVHEFVCSSHETLWNYLTVQLNRLSEDEAGDPDLYGMFYGGTNVRMLLHIL